MDNLRENPSKTVPPDTDSDTWRRFPTFIVDNFFKKQLQPNILYIESLFSYVEETFKSIN